jgi:excisionase family DNA binding protein
MPRLVTVLLDYEELSNLLKVPKGTLYAWVSEGRIPFIRLGPRTVRFDTEQVQEWLRSRQVTPPHSARHN